MYLPCTKPWAQSPAGQKEAREGWREGERKEGREEGRKRNDKPEGSIQNSIHCKNTLLK
jgi:hypothetical protein